MLVAADTHVHLYPCFDFEAALSAAHRNLSSLLGQRQSADWPRVLFLVERFDCFFLRDLRRGVCDVPRGWQVLATAEHDSVKLSGENGSELYLIGGRQIISSENIELLALGRDLDIPDGLPINDAISAVRQGGGVPVLSWAPGKWFRERGAIIAKLLNSLSAQEVLVGDTSLRPLGWGVPKLMRDAEARNFRVVCGSDPLPFSGEEKQIGQFGTVLDGPLDLNYPAAGLRELLLNPSITLTSTGKRSGPIEFFLRLGHNELIRRGIVKS